MWAAPALLLPLLAMGLVNNERSFSPIEQTIGALPVPVDAQSGTQPLPPGASPLGAAGTGLPTSVTMPIYNNSAQALAARMSLTYPMLTEDRAPSQDEMKSSEYAQLHPRSRMMDDLLVGQVNDLLTSPVSPDISVRIFQEYCNAQPGDPYYAIDIKSLPIDRDLLASLVELASLAPDSGFCPHITNNQD